MLPAFVLRVIFVVSLTSTFGTFIIKPHLSISSP